MQTRVLAYCSPSTSTCSSSRPVLPPARAWGRSVPPRCRLQAASQLHGESDPSTASASPSRAPPPLHGEPKVLDWSSFSGDIHANANSPYLFHDDEDEDEEEEIDYQSRIQGAWSDEAMEEAERKQAAKMESPVASSQQTEQAELVSAYTEDGGMRQAPPDVLYGQMRADEGAGQAHRAMLLLDLRSEADYEAGHAPWAYNVPFALLSDIVRSRLLDGWKPKTLAVMAETDKIAAQASVRLRRVFGFQSVVCVRGGMAAWQDAGLPCQVGPSTCDWSEVFGSPA